MTIQELWHINTEETVIRSIEVSPSQDDLIIQSVYSLVSAGTETLVARAEVPDEMQENMKVPQMQGTFSLPVKYGYSLVGKVIQGPADVIGKRVHCMHPHQDWIVGKELNFSILPENLSSEKAALISNVETAVNAVWDSKVSTGDRVLIAGFGVIGALTALLIAQIPGTEVVVLESNTDRQKLATNLGFKLYSNSQFVKFDLAFNTTSSGEVLQQCIDATAKEATIIEMSWYGTKTVNLKLGASFHSGRKRIIASQVSLIPFEKQARFTYERRKELVIELLLNGIFNQLPLTPLLFIDSPKFFHEMRKGINPNFCTLLKYE